MNDVNPGAPGGVSGRSALVVGGGDGGVLRELVKNEHIVHIDLLPIGAPRRDWQTTVVSDGIVAIRHPDFGETVAMADRVGIELQLYAG